MKTNREFAKEDADFRGQCRKLYEKLLEKGVVREDEKKGPFRFATIRQASKFRRGKGHVWQNATKREG